MVEPPGVADIVVHIGATPEPWEVNACPLVPAAPVSVKPVVMFGVVSVGVVSVLLVNVSVPVNVAKVLETAGTFRLNVDAVLGPTKLT